MLNNNIAFLSSEADSVYILSIGEGINWYDWDLFVEHSLFQMNPNIAKVWAKKLRVFADQLDNVKDNN